MPAERWLRLSAAAAVVLLVVAAGAFAAQWRTSQEAARLRARLTAMQRRPRAAVPGPRPGPTGPSSVALTRVRLVPDTQTAGAAPTESSPPVAPAGRPGQAAGTGVTPVVAGPFSVEATVTNRSDRTLRQPVYAFLIISDPRHPQRPPELQQQAALIESLAPGDTTTAVLTGFRTRDPALRHEVVVTTPAPDPARPGGTVAKVVPEVRSAPRTAPTAPQAPAAGPSSGGAPQPTAPGTTPPGSAAPGATGPQPPGAQGPGTQPPGAPPPGAQGPAGTAPGATGQGTSSQEQE